MNAVVTGVGIAPFTTPRTSAPYDEMAESAIRAALAPDAGIAHLAGQPPPARSC